MRVLIAGSSGLIGSALVAALRIHDYTVTRLVRRKPRLPDELSWDPEGFGVPDEALRNIDAVVFLGGLGVGDRRWTGHYRQQLRDSRINPTHVLADAVANSDVGTFLSASATGFYGDTGDHAATELDGPGTGFLPELVTAWEDAASAAAENSRVVLLRTAPVLSPSGGLLAKFRPLVKIGLGGCMGSGRQFFSWITLRDEIAAIEFLLDQSTEISGPVNLSSPMPVRFADFISTYGSVLHRSTCISVPAAVLRLIGGDMAKELILGSSRVIPNVLSNAGFIFTDESLVSALNWTK